MSPEYVGVDVGGTKIAAATLRESGLGESALQPTDATRAEELVDEICESVAEVRTDGTKAVGVGVPAVMDFEAGRARHAVNVPLEDFPVRDVLSDRLGLPVFVDNDATVAAIAEAHDSSGNVVAANLVMFTVGTGVGGGIVIDGRPYRGSSGAAGELGHMLIGVRFEGGAPEAGDFPQFGSLESLAAGRALDALARTAARERPDSFIGRRLAEGDEITGHDAVEGAEAGDEVALGLLRRLGERLGVGIANAINAFDPDVVAIGGGVSVAGDLLVEPAVRVAREYVLTGVGTKTEIRLSEHGPSAGVLGAALLAKLEMQRLQKAG